MARKIKVRLLAYHFPTQINFYQFKIDGITNFAEVCFFFQMKTDTVERSLALVSVYVQPNHEFYKFSHNTVWTCVDEGDLGPQVIDAKTITAVVSMIPCRFPFQPEVLRWFLVEMPGLDVARMGGYHDIDNDPEDLEE